MNKVIAIIPARAGSKGIPGKNSLDLGGRPVVEHTIESAKNSNLIDKIVVSTDCKKVKKSASKFGIEIHNRHPKLCDDNVPLIPDVARSVSALYPEYDIVMVLEPTYPFRDSDTIDKCVSKFLSDNHDWVVTASECRDHPYRCRKELSGNLVPFFNDVNIFAQRQDLPEALMLRGAVYVTSKSQLKNELDQDSSWGYVKISSKQAIDLDEQIDLLVARAVINENQ